MIYSNHSKAEMAYEAKAFFREMSLVRDLGYAWNARQLTCLVCGTSWESLGAEVIGSGRHRVIDMRPEWTRREMARHLCEHAVELSRAGHLCVGRPIPVGYFPLTEAILIDFAEKMAEEQS